MSDSANVIRKALRDDGRYHGQDSAGNEWRFELDDEYSEVWGYREVRNFGEIKEAATKIAEFLQAPAGGPTR